MRRLTPQAARWHQYYLRRNWLNPALASSLPPQRSFSSTSHVYQRDRKNQVTVRHFEQATPNSLDRLEVDPEAEGHENEKFLQSKVAQLEEELKVLKEGPFGPNSKFMRELSEEDRIKAQEVIRKYEAEHAKEHASRGVQDAQIDAGYEAALKKEFDAVMESEKQLWDPTRPMEQPAVSPKEDFEVELTIPDAQQAYVSRFNKTLKSLRNNPSASQKQDAWRSYRRCKQSLPFFLDIVPAEALNILWNGLLPASGPAPPGSSQWEALAKDILSSGRDLETYQWLDYMTLLRRDGKPIEALAIWKERRSHLEHYNSDQLRNYWGIGVQLFVATNDPTNAQNTAMILLEMDPLSKPLILVPVIICWAQSDTKDGETRAWALYLHLKLALGEDMTMEDYDALSVGLLNAGRSRLALAVFKDMMLTGRDSPADSTALYKASLGLVGKLHSSSIKESDVNKVSLAALTILPRQFQNKFFYASWIKKLIGLGEIDAAAKVVELMYERGTKPDVKHLNGLVGAWFREGSIKSKGKAEQLAWTMIQERINRIWGDQSFNPPVHQQPQKPGPLYLQRTVPEGNIETFSILLLYYTRRGEEKTADYLIDCLHKAQIRPNAFFMNHLLYKELRQQNIFGVWSKYRDMTQLLKPDLETFACLWDCGKIQYDRAIYNFDEHFPPPRLLYKEMLDWYYSLSPSNRDIARSDFSKDLYDLIIRCFCLSLDLHGALVALRSMHETFGILPDETTAQILAFSIVRLAPATKPENSRMRRRRMSSTPRARDNVESVGKILGMLREQKAEKLSQQGEELEELDVDTRKLFELGLLCDLLRVILRRIQNEPASVEESIQVAAGEMSVPQTNLDDPVIQGLNCPSYLEGL